MKVIDGWIVERMNKLFYFCKQEELATIFRSVTLHNDALVQYDELDALFSQFVVNAQINGNFHVSYSHAIVINNLLNWTTREPSFNPIFIQ